MHENMEHINITEPLRMTGEEVAIMKEIVEEATQIDAEAKGLIPDKKEISSSLPQKKSEDTGSNLTTSAPATPTNNNASDSAEINVSVSGDNAANNTASETHETIDEVMQELTACDNGNDNAEITASTPTEKTDLSATTEQSNDTELTAEVADESELSAEEIHEEPISPTTEEVSNANDVNIEVNANIENAEQLGEAVAEANESILEGATLEPELLEESLGELAKEVVSLEDEIDSMLSDSETVEDLPSDTEEAVHTEGNVPENISGELTSENIHESFAQELSDAANNADEEQEQLLEESEEIPTETNVSISVNAMQTSAPEEVEPDEEVATNDDMTDEIPEAELAPEDASINIDSFVGSLDEQMHKEVSTQQIPEDMIDKMAKPVAEDNNISDVSNIDDHKQIASDVNSMHSMIDDLEAQTDDLSATVDKIGDKMVIIGHKLHKLGYKITDVGHKINSNNVD